MNGKPLRDGQYVPDLRPENSSLPREKWVSLQIYSHTKTLGPVWFYVYIFVDFSKKGRWRETDNGIGLPLLDFIMKLLSNQLICHVTGS